MKDRCKSDYIDLIQCMEKIHKYANDYYLNSRRVSLHV
jgi:hypothetical protein